MFFNYWIGLLNETYLYLAVCTELNFYYFKWETYGEIINSSITLLCCMLVIAFPFFVAIFYSKEKNYDRIMNRDEEFLEKFGGAITGLNFKRRGKHVLIYATVSLL